MRNYFKLPLLAFALAMPSTGFAKSFSKEKDLAAYLMVFHYDDTHGLYMAMSREREKENELRNGNETEPQLLFEYPIENKTAIDGDICYAQGKYHLFYVAHDGTPGIK